VDIKHYFHLAKKKKQYSLQQVNQLKIVHSVQTSTLQSLKRKYKARKLLSLVAVVSGKKGRIAWGPRISWVAARPFKELCLRGQESMPSTSPSSVRHLGNSFESLNTEFNTKCRACRSEEEP
jgi:hypothetical protein